MGLEAAVFLLLLMTCCNGDECSAYSNAIFWHSSCEKGHLLNTTGRKLLFQENTNSDSTINLKYFPSPLHLLLGCNCPRAWSEAGGAHTAWLKCLLKAKCQVQHWERAFTGWKQRWAQSPSTEESGRKGKQPPRASSACPWENQQTLHTSDILTSVFPDRESILSNSKDGKNVLYLHWGNKLAGNPWLPHHSHLLLNNLHLAYEGGLGQS